MKNKAFRERLQEVLNRKKWTQADLFNRCCAISASGAADINITRQDISKYCIGRAVPRAKKLSIIAQALGVEADWLLSPIGAEDAAASTGIDAAIELLCSISRRDIDAGGDGRKVYRRTIGDDTYIICIARTGDRTESALVRATQLLSDIILGGGDADLVLDAMRAIDDDGLDKELLRRILYC